jgi:uncharacterized protein involved in exopolysaccharide biosynthesis
MEHITDQQNGQNGMSFPYQNQDTISLLDILAVFAKRKKFIIIATVISIACILGYLYYSKYAPVDAFFNVLPDKYQPKVKVRLQEEAGGVGGSNMPTSGLGALAGLAGAAQGKNLNVGLAQELIESNTLVDQIVEEFDFVERYQFEEFPRSQARKQYRDNLDTQYDEESGILTISYLDTDSKLAADIVNRSVELLEKRFRELTMQRISNKKEFLQERLEQVNKDLKEAQNELIDFQIDQGIVEAIPRRESTTNTLAIELTFSSFLPRKERNKIQLQYMDLYRDYAILEGVYNLLMQQYEQAKIEEMDESKTFQVLETGEVLEKKSKPWRSLIVVLGTAVAFFIIVFIAFFMEYFERVKHDPIESKKLEVIQNSFRRPKKQ